MEQTLVSPFPQTAKSEFLKCHKLFIGCVCVIPRSPSSHSVQNSEKGWACQKGIQSPTHQTTIVDVSKDVHIWSFIPRWSINPEQRLQASPAGFQHPKWHSCLLYSYLNFQTLTWAPAMLQPTSVWFTFQVKKSSFYFGFSTMVYILFVSQIQVIWLSVTIIQGWHTAGIGTIGCWPLLMLSNIATELLKNILVAIWELQSPTVFLYALFFCYNSKTPLCGILSRASLCKDLPRATVSYIPTVRAKHISSIKTKSQHRWQEQQKNPNSLL